MIAALDVEFLYRNIDHDEGAKTCENYWNKRNNQHIATKVLKNLILLFLRMSTMTFWGRNFHQTEGTDIATPMAVNYGNCFMGHFETKFVARL